MALSNLLSQYVKTLWKRDASYCWIKKETGFGRMYVGYVSNTITTAVWRAAPTTARVELYFSRAESHVPVPTRVRYGAMREEYKMFCASYLAYMLRRKEDDTIEAFFCSVFGVQQLWSMNFQKKYLI